MTTVTLYTKPDCPLCDEALAALERVRRELPFELEAIDVSNDRDMLDRYGERLPVGLLDGEEMFEYWVDEPELRARLAVSPDVARTTGSSTLPST